MERNASPSTGSGVPLNSQAASGSSPASSSIQMLQLFIPAPVVSRDIVDPPNVKVDTNLNVRTANKAKRPSSFMEKFHKLIWESHNKVNDRLDQIHNDLVCIGQVLCRLELVIVHPFGNPAVRLLVPGKLGSVPFA